MMNEEQREPTPREAIPPAERPTDPESEPSGGITVECSQPEYLYVLAGALVSGKERGPKNISSTDINDGLFGIEITQLVGFPPQAYSRTSNTFSLNSDIELSRAYRDNPDHGFFDVAKVKRITVRLTAMGLQATYSQRANGVNLITIEQSGFFIAVYFSVSDQETKRQQLLAQLEDQKTRDPNYSGSLETYQLNQGPKNRSIMLSLVSKERVETGYEGYPQLADEAQFTQAAQTYAEVYQSVLRAIYEEEGITQPNVNIILRPPIANRDAFTEIASIEGAPIAISQEQIQPDRITFADIAGQDGAVAEARKLVRAINQPEVYARRGGKRPKGILMYGPPGTGKTLIARAIANEADAVFFEISAADIGTKWYGESVQLMQQVFDRANAAVAQGRKVIIFVDEVDSLAPSREGAHEETRKVVATLLKNLDGTGSNPNVTFIATTNRPEDIDPALKRPGRIDKILHVDLPSEEGRVQILRVHIEKARSRAEQPDELFLPEIDLVALSGITEGMSGADLANVINLAQEDKIMAELEGHGWTPVTTDDITAVIRRVGILQEERRRIGFTIPPKK